MSDEVYARTLEELKRGLDEGKLVHLPPEGMISGEFELPPIKGDSPLDNDDFRTRDEAVQDVVDKVHEMGGHVTSIIESMPDPDDQTIRTRVRAKGPDAQYHDDMREIGKALQSDPRMVFPKVTHAKHEYGGSVVDPQAIDRLSEDQLKAMEEWAQQQAKEELARTLSDRDKVKTYGRELVEAEFAEISAEFEPAAPEEAKPPLDLEAAKRIEEFLDRELNRLYDPLNPRKTLVIDGVEEYIPTETRKWLADRFTGWDMGYDTDDPKKLTFTPK